MKQLFYFYGYRLKVLRWQKGKVVAANIFEPNDEGFQQFRNFVKDYKNIKTMMLVDIIEEDFQSDTIPKVRGNDRKALINRALDKSFFEITYRYAISHGTSKTNKNQEDILLGALTNADLITPWLSEIRRQKIRLVGIQSITTVGEALLPKIGINGEPTLLITQQLPWTIRQSFYKDGQLHFSRLIPTRLNDISEFPNLVLNEVDQTVRYLQYKRLINDAEEINTIMITAEEYALHLNKTLDESPSLDYKSYTVPEIASMIGIKEPYESTTADIIFAHLADVKPRNHYGRDDDILCHQSHKLKNFIQTMTAAVFIIGIGASAFFGINSAIFSKNTVTAEKNASYFQRKYEEQSQQLDDLLSNAEIMKQSVDAIAKLTRDETYTPTFIFEQFSQIISKYPQIKLDRLRLKYDSGYNNPDTNNLDNIEVNLEPIVPGHPKPIIEVNASLKGLDKNYRESLKIVAKFKKELQQLNTITDVEITKQPVEITSKTQFSGNTGVSITSTDKSKDKNKFSIRITFKRNLPQNSKLSPAPYPSRKQKLSQSPDFSENRGIGS